MHDDLWAGVESALDKAQFHSTRRLGRFNPRANRVERRPRIDGDNIAHARAVRDVSPVHHESEPGRPSSDASAAARTFKANRSSV
jgi:hypothetical protein